MKVLRLLVITTTPIIVFAAAVVVLFLLSPEPKPNIRPASACYHNVRQLYLSLFLYCDEYSILPSNISDDQWVQLVLPYLGSDEKVRKRVLNCPVELDINGNGRIEDKELNHVPIGQTSYRINPAVLGRKWEDIGHLKIPLLIEKKPNHHGALHVVYTNGDIEFTYKQPDLSGGK